ncbi:MlaD family protein [Gordonia hankookensis]|uniref:MCE family protein n=1 Tax=Gordonia hankookensis TaxID=589403 RepID=A0ABR7WGT6_9ACTN|nr:MlaD family protein [Gordonia hankookensis]MBD1321982.1 MCE family protein [Gordonia hankookensis]
MTRGTVISLGAILAVLVIGVAYLAFGVLGVAPFREDRTATLVMTDSGGLEVNSPVLLTGFEIGEVTALRVGDHGVQTDIRYRAEYPIPASSTLSVQTLSALGEPYLEFVPATDGGPDLADGQVVDTRATTKPVTIADTATRAVAMLDQFDPDVISRLVHTIDTALDGTDAVMPRLQRSTRLLAETLMVQNPQFEKLLSSIQSIGGDLDWLGPTLEAGGPAWASVGDRVIAPLATKMAELTDARNPSVYTTGDGIIPFLHRINEVLLEIGPSVKPLAPMLQPVVAQATTGVSGLDIGALVTQALGTVGSDGAIHLQLNIPQPQPK